MPYDYLTGDDVEQDELDYRNQIRDSVVNGDIQARPKDDGSWDFSPPDQPLPRTLDIPQYRVLDQPQAGADASQPDEDTTKALNDAGFSDQANPKDKATSQVGTLDQLKVARQKYQDMLDAGTVTSEQANDAFQTHAATVPPDGSDIIPLIAPITKSAPQPDDSTLNSTGVPKPSNPAPGLINNLDPTTGASGVLSKGLSDNDTLQSLKETAPLPPDKPISVLDMAPHPNFAVAPGIVAGPDGIAAPIPSLLRTVGQPSLTESVAQHPLIEQLGRQAGGFRDTDTQIDPNATTSDPFTMAARAYQAISPAAMLGDPHDTVEDPLRSAQGLQQEAAKLTKNPAETYLSKEAGKAGGGQIDPKTGKVVPGGIGTKIAQTLVPNNLSDQVQVLMGLKEVAGWADSVASRTQTVQDAFLNRTTIKVSGGSAPESGLPPTSDPIWNNFSKPTSTQVNQIINDAAHETAVNAMRTGEDVTGALNDQQVMLLKAPFDSVVSAAPDDMVTVYSAHSGPEAVDIGANGTGDLKYHWTPNKNVQSIIDNGLNPGSWLADTPEKARSQARVFGNDGGGTVIAFKVNPDQVSAAKTTLLRQQAFRANEALQVYTDPEVASLAAVKNGVTDPNLLSYQVPRSQLDLNPATSSFTPKGNIFPIVNDAVNGWVANAKDVVTNWLHGAVQATGSEVGSFRVPGSDEPIPDDVAKLAFGDEGAADLARGNSGISNGAVTAEPSKYEFSSGRESTWHDANVQLLNQNIETARLPDQVLGMRYDEARQSASKAQNALDDISNGVQPEGTVGEQALYQQSYHDNLLRGIADAQKYGEEMYRRSGGKEGLAPKLQNAVRNMLVNEEGAIYPGDIIDAIRNGGKGPTDYAAIPAPPVATAHLTGIGPIDPHLTPVQRITNVTRDALSNLPRVSDKGVKEFMGMWDDPLTASLVRERTKAMNILNHYRSADNAMLNAVFSKAFEFEKDGVTLKTSTTDPRGVPSPGMTISDIRDNYAAHEPWMTDTQKTAMQTLDRIMEKYENAAVEQNLVATDPNSMDIVGRGSIQPGGKYTPRGRLVTAKDDTATVRPQLRAVKKSFEKPAVFNSQAEGMEWAAKNGTGKEYQPFLTAMDNYFRDVGTRVLDSHLSNVLMQAKDNTGQFIASTPQARLMRQNPRLASVTRQLRKDLTTLVGSSANIDAKARAVLTNYIYTPAPDLTELQNAMASISTKGGTLRIRPTFAPADQATDFGILNKETKNLFVNRGKYTGLTKMSAEKAAVQSQLENMSVTRGKFKGLTPDEVTAVINRIKGTITSIKPQYDAAMAQAALPAPGEGFINPNSPIGRLTSNKGYAFPNAVSSSMNQWIKNSGPVEGWPKPFVSAANTVNNHMRAIQTLSPFAHQVVQGILMTPSHPLIVANANFHTMRALLDPVNGDKVLGQYFLDHDARAAKENGPTIEDLAGAGLHFAGSNTEHMGAIRGLPVARQMSQAFGNFGDMLRSSGAYHEYMGRDTSSLSAADKQKLLTSIAHTYNGMTGWSPNRFGGPLGSVISFAPRFYMSQVETLATAVKGNEVERSIARNALLMLVGTGAAVTAAANHELGHDIGNTEFNWWSPLQNGKPNPNFMRIRTPKGTPGGQLDLSMFGPWEALYHGLIGIATGDPLFVIRSKASPVGALLGAIFTGTDAIGNPVNFDPTKSNFNAWRMFVPFMTANIGHESALQTAYTATGMKASALSNSEARQNSLQTEVQKMLADGTIKQADAKNYTDLNALTSAEMKQITLRWEKDDPSGFAQWGANRAAQHSVFQGVADASEGALKTYQDNTGKQMAQLIGGVGPKDAWSAYDNSRQQLAGARAIIYGGSKTPKTDAEAKALGLNPNVVLKQSQDFQKAVAALPNTDIRKYEAMYNNLTTQAYDAKGGIMTSDDFNQLAAAKALFMQNLTNAQPDLAARLTNSIALATQNSFDDGTPMDKLRKSAQTMLQPYYDLVAQKTPEATQQATAFLNQNSQADFMHWMTEKTTNTPDLHSIDAVATAIKAVPNRPAKLAGASTIITADNLPVAQQYSTQINQLLTLPRKETDPSDGIITNPVNQLRRGDPLYDALYFWLGMEPPTKDTGVDNYKNRNKDTAPVYNLPAVESYLQQWGSRTDGALPRRAN